MSSAPTLATQQNGLLGLRVGFLYLCIACAKILLEKIILESA